MPRTTARQSRELPRCNSCASAPLAGLPEGNLVAEVAQAIDKANKMTVSAPASPAAGQAPPQQILLSHAASLPASQTAAPVARKPSPARQSAAGWAAGEQQRQREEQVRQAAAAYAKEKEQSATSFGKALRAMSSRLTPTNYNMLLFRTLNRDLCLPNANDDYIAPLFRDKLMPIRSWVQRSVPGMTAVTRKGVEDPAVGVPGVCNFVDARTKWIDGALKQALDDGVKQVVCLAAGYDTRAYRFSRHAVKFFELDLPSASKRKQALVRACLPGPDKLPRPIYIAADLGKVTLGQALAGTGFDPAKPTFFTCEGLVYYLPEAAVATLIASVADVAAPGSRLLFDFLHADAADGTAFYPGYHACAESVAGKGEAFISGLHPSPDELAAYLAPLNWQLSAAHSPQQMVAKELPHEPWNDELPPILSFYSYCEAMKPRLDGVPAATDTAAKSAAAARQGSSSAEALHRERSLIQALTAAELR